MGTKHLRAAQKLAADTLVDLYTLDISRYGGPVLRWTPGPLGAESRNLLANHSLRTGTTGWVATDVTAWGPAAGLGAAYQLRDYGSGYFRRAGTYSGTSTIALIGTNGAFTAINNCAEAGQVWEVQARVVPIRCTARVELRFLSSNNTILQTIEGGSFANTGTPESAARLDDYTILHARGVAPANTARVRLVLRMLPAGGGSIDPAIVFSMGQIARVAVPLNAAPDAGFTGPLPWSEGRGVGSVTFAGQAYTAFPLLIESISWTARGPRPRPRVTIPDIDSYATGLLLGYQQLLGCPVRRTRVFAANLDNGPDPDTTSFFGPETWYVDRVARHMPGEVLVLELADPLDLQGKLLPGRQVIRDVCTHIYRRWNGTGFTAGTCPYAGGDYWRADGTVTALPAEDACGKRITDCKKRFPNQALPTRAFPGVSKYRI
jgi:lambda family phage minor tail protein L